MSKLLNPINYVNFAQHRLGELKYLTDTYASSDVFGAYLKGRAQKSKIENKYREDQSRYRESIKNLSLTNDWFTTNIPYWLSVFEQFDFNKKENLKALEIGSWEGLSSHFFLSTLQGATLTCVDTWAGADEHKSGDAATSQVLSKIESVFDRNLNAYQSRLKKYKGTSYAYFNDHSFRNEFDFIYVDGSHHVDDVIIDAIRCFQMLKVGGVMVFDDYFWKYYPNPIDNPASAVNCFLRLKKGAYRIQRLYYQMIIEKIKD